jgi:DNA polymerase III sliding clamp (beta) subunit (PCNA family)
MSKIALPIAELKPALIGFGKIIAKRTSLPVLNHIKIERTKEGWIGLTATDLDHHVTLRLEQPSEGEPVSLLVPYDELQKVSKACTKADNILISAGAKNAVILEYAIGNQTAEVKVDSLPVAEFPEIPRIKGDSIPVNDALRQSIHEALECASTDETRFILNGAFIDVSKKDAHYVVGTDGRHLFSSNSFILPLKDSIIIPSHKFIDWKEFSRDGEWALKVMPKTKEDETPQFQISSRRWRFISRQIEGNYPNWRQVVTKPADTKTKIELESELLPSLVATVERMPCHDAINFAIGLETIGRKLFVLGKTPNAEKWTKVEVADAKITGDNVTIYLNRHLLTKALKFGLNTVDIIDPLTPLRISNGGRQIIIMPTRPDTSPAPASPQPASPQPAADQSAASPQAAQESTTMAKQTNTPAASPASTNGSNGTTGSPAEKSSIEAALTQIEAIKGSYREAIRGLNDLTDTLKQVQRDQKSTDKEVQSVRSTLEKLQSVKL